MSSRTQYDGTRLQVIHTALRVGPHDHPDQVRSMASCMGSILGVGDATYLQVSSYSSPSLGSRVDRRQWLQGWRTFTSVGQATLRAGSCEVARVMLT